MRACVKGRGEKGVVVEGVEMVVVGKVERGVYTWLKIRSAFRSSNIRLARSATARTFPPGRSWFCSHRASFNPQDTPFFLFHSYLLQAHTRMLEAFEILTTSGVVLWSKSYVPVGAHVVNSLINDVFIEEKVVPQASANSALPIYKKEKYTLKWKRVKEFNLIFVVCSVSWLISPASRSPGSRIANLL